MKKCTNCSAAFAIPPEDQAFYKTIAVPEPTLCPDCRQQRRLAWRNERQMYKRKCDFSDKEIISMYPPDSPFPVYEQDFWWSDQWDALSYGRDFDFSRSFWDQFRELQLSVPRLALVNKQSKNSHYTNHAGKNKNCYLSGCIFGSEDVLYSDWVMNSRNLIDCSYIFENCELCYEVYYAWNSYEAFFCDFIKSCHNVWFCYDCINCQHCFLCLNLRNKKYHIANTAYSKEEYERKMQQILPLSHKTLEFYQKKYLQLKNERAIRPATYQVQTENCSGDLLFTSKNCDQCFDTISTEDSKYCYDSIDVKNTMDVYHVGWSELMYECHAVINAYDTRFCHFCYDNSYLQYCDCCHNSQNLFGCCGLNQKQYCILNKQYSKKDYHSLQAKIIAHMKQTGEYGEFFSMAFSPFAYNQSRAQEYYPLSPDKAVSRDLSWSSYSNPLPEATRSLAAEKLLEYITDTPDDVVNWLIIPNKTDAIYRPYRIQKAELAFYRKTGLPLPHKHPDQRYEDRLAQRNPRKLWQRNCAQCKQNIETSFSPESTARVYCEECYKKVIYS